MLGYRPTGNRYREEFPPRRYEMTDNDRDEFTVRSTVVKMKNGTVYEFFTREVQNESTKVKPDGTYSYETVVNEGVGKVDREYRWVRYDPQ